eukprot:12034832-Alexandrium_andersonii.AAC.1
MARAEGRPARKLPRSRSMVPARAAVVPDDSRSSRPCEPGGLGRRGPASGSGGPRPAREGLRASTPVCPPTGLG